MLYFIYAVCFCVCYCLLYYCDPLLLIEGDGFDRLMVVAYTLLSLLWPMVLAIMVLYLIGILLTMLTNKIVYGVAYEVIDDEENADQ